MSKISVRFLFEKEKKRVVWAEVGSDFIDVLFCFLTQPLGSIVQVLGKKSELGSLDTLYDGVEQLDEQYFKTEACKKILLNPRGASMITEWQPEKSEKGRIFVKRTTKFMITDDLRVMPTSMMRGYSLLKELGIEDPHILETRIIDFSTKEMLNLLRRALVSKNPLTEICFSDVSMQASVNYSSTIKEEMNADEGDSQISLKLILNKKNNKVLYAEGGEDFVNQLVSFLTFPLVAVLRILTDNASVQLISGCITNLYSSVESIGLDCLIKENCKNILLNQKFSIFYGFEKQLLKLEEIIAMELSVSGPSGGCPKCYSENGHKPCIPSPCKHGVKQSKVIEQNLNGGVFVISSRRFMIADNLQISPSSFISFIDRNEINFSISDLVEKDVCVGKAKVLSLLSAMLISKTVLTDVFCPQDQEAKSRGQTKSIF